MSEMVERCAIAAAAVDNSLWVGEDADGYFEKVARAVIKAMREPTDEMARIGLYLTEGSDPDFKDIWRQMINKALK